MTEEMYEAKGRRVMQHCMDELEKIAASPKALQLVQAARGAQATAGSGAKQLGLMRYVPFTRAHRAHFGHVGTGGGLQGAANTATRTARQRLSQEEKLVMDALARGRGTPQANMSALQRLKAAKAQLDAAEGGVRQRVRLATGTEAPLPGMDPRVKRGIQMAAGGTGLLAATGAAGYGAKTLYDRRQEQAGGYGGGY